MIKSMVEALLLGVTSSWVAVGSIVDEVAFSTAPSCLKKRITAARGLYKATETTFYELARSARYWTC